MSLLSSLRRALVLVLLATSSNIAFAADPPTFPPGKDLSTPKPMKKPGTIAAWHAVITRDAPTIYKSFDGEEVYPSPSLKFGDSSYVVHSHESASGKPSRILLAKFSGEGTTFDSWIGWIDPNYVVDRSEPLKVKPAREALIKAVPKGHPYYDRIQRSFPDASREDFQNVTLKAVTHPERGKACFPRPVSPEEYEKLAKTDQAIALQPFAFFYVYAIAVEPKNVYCLLGSRGNISLTEGYVGDKLRQQLVGWVELDSLMLWTTREAFEYNLEEPVLKSRRGNKSPIELYSTSKDLKDWAAWALDGRKGGNPIKPIYIEELDPAKAPPWMQKTWDGRWMRYPILSSYPLQGQGVAESPVSGINGKWLGYQLCVLGNTKSSGGGGTADIEEMKKKINDAVKATRVFDLVIVLDTTASMGPVFAPLKEGVVKMVEELKRRAGSEKDELERIQIRVAVVQYKDFPIQDSEFLTKDSGDYFDVMTDAGLNEFKEYVGAIKDGGGGDELEEPFEGITLAVKKFLSLKDSKHTPGAARVMLVLGDAGNHEKDPSNDKIGTRLTFEDVLKQLDPLGEDSIGRQKKAVAKIQLHSVMTFLFENDDKKQREGLKKWEAQIHELARKTGGTTHELNFVDKDKAEEATNRMVDALSAALEVRRSLLRKELEELRLSFGATPDGKASGAAAASLMLAEARLEELLGKDELARIRKSLSQAFFTEVHTVEQIPTETEQLARLRLCVLLSDTEFLKIGTVTQILAEGLDSELMKGGLAGDSGEKIEAKIKELVIRTMLIAFGEDVTPARVESLKKKPFGEIQKEVNQLPVQFNILKTQPSTEAQLKKMIEQLKDKAAKMREINNSQRNIRMFNAGVATGEPHIWLYKHELP